MLKYILIFCIISICVSSLRTTGDYDVILYSQRSPVTTYYTLKRDLQMKGYSFQQANEFLSTKNAYELMTFDAKNWIIYLLGSLTVERRWLLDCVDTKGKALFYKRRIPTYIFRSHLRKVWPTPAHNLTHDQTWEVNFDLTGCCIETSPLRYFEKAKLMHQDYNIERILGNARIVPGKKYVFEQIYSYFVTLLHARPYIKCQEAENPNEQYLLEIVLCFNKTQHLMNCDHPVASLCNPEKLVTYPTWEIAYQ